MLVPALVLVWVVLGLFVTVGRSRSRLETRAELLDLVADACRRGLSLPPLLASFADEAAGGGRRAIRALAARMEAGAPLGEALGRMSRRLVPPHVVAAVTAAEGTPRLPAVLETVAADAGEALAMRHRFLVAALYPLLLAFLLFGVHTGSVAALVRVVDGAYAGPRLSTVFTSATVALLVAAVALVLVPPVLRRLGLLPFARRLAAARVLATGALLVDAGLPLDDALRRAAPAGGHRRLAHEVARAAEDLAAGAGTGRAWSALGLPAVARLRLEASPAAALGDVMAQVAGRAFDAWRLAGERLLRWMTPVAVVLVGAVVLLDFHAVMSTMAHARDSVRLW